MTSYTICGSHGMYIMGVAPASAKYHLGAPDFDDPSGGKAKNAPLTKELLSSQVDDACLLVADVVPLKTVLLDNFLLDTGRLVLDLFLLCYRWFQLNLTLQLKLNIL